MKYLALLLLFFITPAVAHEWSANLVDPGETITPILGGFCTGPATCTDAALIVKAKTVLRTRYCIGTTCSSAQGAHFAVHIAKRNELNQYAGTQHLLLMMSKNFPSAGEDVFVFKDQHMSLLQTVSVNTYWDPVYCNIFKKAYVGFNAGLVLNIAAAETPSGGGYTIYSGTEEPASNSLPCHYLLVFGGE